MVGTGSTVATIMVGIGSTVVSLCGFLRRSLLTQLVHCSYIIPFNTGCWTGGSDLSDDLLDDL